MSEYLEETLMSKEDGEKLTQNDLMMISIKALKYPFISTIVFFNLSALMVIGATVCVLKLLTSIQNVDYGLSYIYCILLVLLWYLYQLFDQRGNFDLSIFYSQLRVGLIMLLYGKISKMTLYEIQYAELGAINNMISNDLEILCTILFGPMYVFSLPVIVVGSSVILYSFFGWSGFVGILFLLLVVLITTAVSSINGRLMEELGVERDKRVEITTEIIEGIKYVKMYGW